MGQVHLADLAGPGKLPGPAPGVGNSLELLALEKLDRGLGKVRQRFRQGGLQLRQVHHGQGGGLAPAFLRANLHKAVHDVPPDLDGGHGGVLAEGGEPVGVVPAHARLRLLRSDEIVGAGGHGQGRLHRGHQAGVKADKVEFHPSGPEGGVQPRQVHGPAGGELLVVAVAADRAASVVPEDQLIPAGRVVGGAPLDVSGQGVRVRHGGAAQVLFQAGQLAVPDLPDLIDIIDSGAYFTRQGNG